MITPEERTKGGAEPPFDGALLIDLANRPAPLKDQVLPLLREAIIEGTLAPGTRLSEAGLSRRIKVSRSPIREALVRLQDEGLVVMIPHVGTFVREMRRDEVEGLYQVRAALEPLAASLAAEKGSALSRRQLSPIVDEMAQAVERQDRASYAAATDRFHWALLQMSDNPALVRAYQALSGPARQIRRMTMAVSGRLPPSMEQHRAIAHAVLEGDAEGAAERMRKHLAEAASVALASLSSAGRSMGP